MIEITKEILVNETNKTYDIWFERYLKNYDIKKEMIILAKQGKTSMKIAIRRSEIKESRDARMGYDSRFVDKLKKAFPEMRISVDIRKGMMGNEIGKIIEINWGTEYPGGDL